jgi:hypothetical protein
MIYYIIETKYVGPNQLDHQHIDSHVFDVCTKPALTNSSREVRTDGWCGTNNDWATYAHGSFTSQEIAEDCIHGRLLVAGCRAVDIDDIERRDREDGVVARYKPGRFEPMTSEATGDWIADGLHEIEADTSDKRLAEIVAECQETCRTDHGCKLDEDTLEEAIKERRQEMIDELTHASGN